ncbi:MAG: EF-hand domain-containing protein [Haliea sp.]|nr:MAG: EF-hand domain-containing protein [Haliea sp.]
MSFPADHTPSPARRPHAGPAARASAASTTPTLIVLGAALGLATAAVLFASGAQAQAAPAAAATPPVAAVPAAAEPKYTVAQIAQAFSFIDSNRDGKLSREESAGFRGVARHFDEADLNKDGVLSREEFENALTEKNR